LAVFTITPVADAFEVVEAAEELELCFAVEPVLELPQAARARQATPAATRPVTRDLGFIVVLPIGGFADKDLLGRTILPRFGHGARPFTDGASGPVMVHTMDQGSSGALEGSHSNRSVERACRILTAFTLEQPSLSLTELARRAELPKATTHRLASTLRGSGLLTQAADGSYALGVKLLELGSVVRESLDVVQLCRAPMDQIAAATGETVLLITADWTTREVLLVARRNSPHPLAVGSQVVRPQPIPPGGAMGKALLAGLPPDEVESVVEELTLVAMTPKTPIERRQLLRHIAQARKTGYASEQDEFLEGVSGVAVPVLFDGGRPLAALGVAGPTSRLKGEISALGESLLKLTATLRPSRLDETANSAA
jgi:DNA-binding IclR family transcriptional regulator